MGANGDLKVVNTVFFNLISIPFRVNVMTPYLKCVTKINTVNQMTGKNSLMTNIVMINFTQVKGSC